MLRRKTAGSFLSRQYVLFNIFRSALTAAFLCVGAADAFDALFLLAPKVEADRSDDGGDDEYHDDIGKVFHYFLSDAMRLLFFAMRAVRITMNAATATAPPIVPPTLSAEGAVMSVPIVLTR